LLLLVVEFRTVSNEIEGTAFIDDLELGPDGKPSAEALRPDSPHCSETREDTTDD
jgi:hypothetical protein